MRTRRSVTDTEEWKESYELGSTPTSPTNERLQLASAIQLRLEIGNKTRVEYPTRRFDSFSLGQNLTTLLP